MSLLKNSTKPCIFFLTLYSISQVFACRILQVLCFVGIRTVWKVCSFAWKFQNQSSGCMICSLEQYNCTWGHWNVSFIWIRYVGWLFWWCLNLNLGLFATLRRAINMHVWGTGTTWSTSGQKNLNISLWRMARWQSDLRCRFQIAMKNMYTLCRHWSITQLCTLFASYRILIRR